MNRCRLLAKKTGLKISCHHLRHTMATQLLNAGVLHISRYRYLWSWGTFLGFTDYKI